MTEYKVGLTRTFIVTVNAESEEQAKEFAEYYLSMGGEDLSTVEDREEKNFSFEEVEAVGNEGYSI